MKNDEQFMQEAIGEAQKAFALGEVPVGAVLVYQGKIIARGHNLVEANQDATAHAEILCLKQASAHLENWRLTETTLYCTLEPCAMCAGAMLLSRIQTLVWAAPDLRHGAHGSWTDLLSIPHPMHRLSVRSGILRDEASHLMTTFFRERRNNAKTI